MGIIEEARLKRSGKLIFFPLVVLAAFTVVWLVTNSEPTFPTDAELPQEPISNNPEKRIDVILPSQISYTDGFRNPLVVDALSGEEIRTARFQYERLNEWIRVKVAADGFFDAYRWFNSGTEAPLMVALSPRKEDLYREAAWKNPKGPRLIMLQFDGITERLFLERMRNDELPAMKVLLERGSWGLLKSCCMLDSPSVWTTILTGLGPEEHGIIDFVDNTMGDDVPLLITCQQIRAPRLWDLVRKAGMKAFIGNVLLPPGEYENPMMNGDLKIKTIRDEMRNQSFDLVVIYDAKADVEGHQWWKAYEADVCRSSGWRISRKEEDFHHDRLAQAYSFLDSITAVALKLAGPNTIIYIMSDHGFDGCRFSCLPVQIQMNRLFADSSIPELVSASTEPDDMYMYNLLFEADDLQKIDKIAHDLEKAKLLGGKPLFFQVIKRGIQEGIPSRYLISVKLNYLAVVDEFYNQGSIVFGGKQILLSQIANENYTSGNHLEMGMFLIGGAGIVYGGRVQNASVYDVMPTSLTILGLPVARDMPGRVWQEIFAHVPRIERINTYGRWEAKPPSTTASPEYLEKLRSLGYL